MKKGYVYTGYRYCVASVYKNCIENNDFFVLFYAHHEKYGTCMTNNINNEDVVWYETEEEALEHRIYAFDCVISKSFK